MLQNRIKQSFKYIKYDGNGRKPVNKEREAREDVGSTTPAWGKQIGL